MHTSVLNDIFWVQRRFSVMFVFLDQLASSGKMSYTSAVTDKMFTGLSGQNKKAGRLGQPLSVKPKTHPCMSQLRKDGSPSESL